MHDVTDGHLRARGQRQVHVDARAEADEAIALAAREALAYLRVAEDAARDQAGDLDATVAAYEEAVRLGEGADANAQASTSNSMGRLLLFWMQESVVTRPWPALSR